MARDGHAPKIFGRRNRNGVPYLAVICVAVFSLISYCQAASSALIARTSPLLALFHLHISLTIFNCMLPTKVQWLTSIVDANGLLNWCIFAFTHIKFQRAMKTQGMDRSALPARVRFLLSFPRIRPSRRRTHLHPPTEPHCTLGRLVCAFQRPLRAPHARLRVRYFSFPTSSFSTKLLSSVHSVFLKGAWNTNSFLYSYLSVAVIPSLFLGWKLLKKTKWHRSIDIDLVTHIDDPAFDEQEDDRMPDKMTQRFLKKIF